MPGRGSWIFVTVAAAMVGLAGCSAAATVAPGHGTPQDAVDGLIKADLSGHWQLACSYFVPAQQASCRAARIQPPTGHASLGNAITSGDLALVDITGHVCTEGNVCLTNTDPSLGLPTGSETFKQAYDKALNNNSGALSPLLCMRVDGKWYVYNQFE
jgi:hypothetical protein